MRNHMLKYHVGVPLLVIAVLLVVGLPATTAVRTGIAAGCLSMVLMVFTPHGHHRRHRSTHSAGSGTPPPAG